MHKMNNEELENFYSKVVKTLLLQNNFLSEENAAIEQFLTDFDDSNYVEIFEEGYAEDFEDERKVEIFKEEQENALSDCFTKKQPIPITYVKEQPMAAPSDHIYYIKPSFGEGDHP